MRAIVLAVMMLVLAGLGGGPARAATTLTVPAAARQLITVASPTDHPRAAIATLRAYTRSSASAPWRLALGPWPAETGSGGLSATRREGDGATAIGVFGIGGTVYGNAPDPGGISLAYHRLDCGDWWDEDPSSPRYNRFVVVPCGERPGFAEGSEALWTDPVAYAYFAVIEFNTDPIRRGANAPGSGIFLHNWIGAATAGCVALHRAQLLEALRWLRAPADPVIAIGTNAEVAPLTGGPG